MAHRHAGPLGQGLWEVRSTLTGNRIARVIFSITGNRMVLLHGFVKKTQKTPDSDLALAPLDHDRDTPRTRVETGAFAPARGRFIPVIHRSLRLFP